MHDAIDGDGAMPTARRMGGASRNGAVRRTAIVGLLPSCLTGRDPNLGRYLADSTVGIWPRQIPPGSACVPLRLQIVSLASPVLVVSLVSASIHVPPS